MMNIYCIKDMKGNFHSLLMTIANDDIARRYIPSMLDECDPIVKRYPQDFVLYRLGTFDFVSGTIVPENTPVYIADMTYGGVHEDMA